MHLGRILRHFGAALVLVSCSVASASPADDKSCELHYWITPRYDVVPRVLEVSLEFPAGGRSESFLRVTPSWAGVEDFASDLGAWQGVGAKTVVATTALPYRLHVSHPLEGRVRVRYESRARLADPDDGKPQNDQRLQYRTQIGADWFQFFGYGVIPSVEPYGDGREVAMCVTISQSTKGEAPPVFGSHFQGRGSDVTTRIFGSPSLLRHAFYAGGLGWRVHERQLSSGTVGVAIRGRFGADDDAFVDEATRLIDTQRRFWGDATALPQWVVITPNHTPYNFGGTLVRNAAVLFANKPFTPQSPGFASLIGHENLHQWIPQRLGADSSDAAFYWFSEGFTDYYTHRLLLSSGHWTLEQYAEALTTQLRGYWQSPARNATAQSIAPRFFSDRDAGKQMYSRGEILALRWDQALRRANKPGLDDVLRGILLPEGTKPTQIGYARVLDALVPALGDMARQDVEQFIVEGKDLPLPSDLLGPCFNLSRQDVPRWILGFDSASTGVRKASGVAVDGPAYKAGLRDEMEILGWSIFSGDVQKDVSLTVVVGGQRLTVSYSPVDGTRDSLPTVTVNPVASRDATCKSWVNRPT